MNMNIHCILSPNILFIKILWNPFTTSVTNRHKHECMWVFYFGPYQPGKTRQDKAMHHIESARQDKKCVTWFWKILFFIICFPINSLYICSGMSFWLTSLKMLQYDVQQQWTSWISLVYISVCWLSSIPTISHHMWFFIISVQLHNASCCSCVASYCISLHCIWFCLIHIGLQIIRIFISHHCNYIVR